jgi:hypothetical protein
MSISGEGLGVLIGLVVVALVSVPAVMVAFLYYRGEDPAERVAAHEREKALLREAAGAPNFNYLLALVWARWRGLTRRDRRVVQLLWVGLAVVFVMLLAIEFNASRLDVEDVITVLVMGPLIVAGATIAVIFRMR